MSSCAGKAVLLAFVGGALMWPVAGDRVKALVTPDAKGCAHSSDLPDPDRGTEARAAILCLLNEERDARASRAWGSGLEPPEVMTGGLAGVYVQKLRCVSERQIDSTRLTCWPSATAKRRLEASTATAGSGLPPTMLVVCLPVSRSGHSSISSPV